MCNTGFSAFPLYPPLFVILASAPLHCILLTPEYIHMPYHVDGHDVLRHCDRFPIHLRFVVVCVCPPIATIDIACTMCGFLRKMCITAFSAFPSYPPPHRIYYSLYLYLYLYYCTTLLMGGLVCVFWDNSLTSPQPPAQMEQIYS